MADPNVIGAGTLDELVRSEVEVEFWTRIRGSKVLKGVIKSYDSDGYKIQPTAKEDEISIPKEDVTAMSLPDDYISRLSEIAKAWGVKWYELPQLPKYTEEGNFVVDGKKLTNKGGTVITIGPEERYVNQVPEYLRLLKAICDSGCEGLPVKEAEDMLGNKKCWKGRVSYINSILRAELPLYMIKRITVDEELCLVIARR